MSKLELTPHAELRMFERKVTHDDMMDAVIYGDRKKEGELVVHHNKQTGIVVVVNWKQMRVITVKRR